MEGHRRINTRRLRNERTTATALERLPGSHHRAGLDRHLLDEAPDYDQRTDQAARRILDESCLSRSGGQISAQRSLPQSGDRDHHANHRNGGELADHEPSRRAKVKTGRIVVSGIAWDGGYGISSVQVSTDGGKTWAAVKLGQDLGRFAFRPWNFDVTA